MYPCLRYCDQQGWLVKYWDAFATASTNPSVLTIESAADAIGGVLITSTGLPGQATLSFIVDAQPLWPCTSYVAVTIQ